MTCTISRAQSIELIHVAIIIALCTMSPNPRIDKRHGYAPERGIV
jgi:hypothetical protein